MSDESIRKAEEAKKRGNEFYAKREWESAIAEFTEAISLNPKNHVYFSNRSACQLEGKRLDSAVQDAEKCISLKPDWPKGYSRLGAALFKKGDFAESKSAYERGLKIDPNSAVLREGMDLCQNQLEQQNIVSNSLMLDLRDKIAKDPELSKHLAEPDFVQKIDELERDPKKYISQHMGDPRIMKVMGLLIREMGINTDAMGGSSGAAATKNATPKSTTHDSAKEEEDASNTESSSKKNVNTEAEELKLKGNEAYKNKDFSTAIEFYTKAHEIDPKNILYLTNRVAVRMMQKDFDKALEDCKKAVEIGRKEFSPYEQIAKAFERMGDIEVKRKDHEKAVEYYKESLLENKVYRVKKKLRKIENELEERNAREYIDPAKALEHKERGNELFKKQDYQTALKEYSESIKRNPEDSRVFSNRAAIYSKLMAWEYALSDCEEAIKLDPTFAKAYLRKGKIMHLLKDYMKAVITFNTGLKHEPVSYQLKEAKQATMIEVMQKSREGGFDKNHQAKAMNDPLVQELMNDPDLRTTLDNMKTNNMAGNAAMSNPEIMEKLEILMAAGVVQMG